MNRKIFDVENYYDYENDSKNFMERAVSSLQTYDYKSVQFENKKG